MSGLLVDHGGGHRARGADELDGRRDRYLRRIMQVPDGRALARVAFLTENLREAQWCLRND